MSLANIGIFLLWFGAVIDPIGLMFGIRYLALATAFTGLAWLFSIPGLKLLDMSYRGALILILSVLLPLYGLTLYSFNSLGADFIDTSYLASGVLILTSMLYYNRSMCVYGVSSFVFSARFLSILIITTYASQEFFAGEWISFFTERDVALIGSRDYVGISFPYIYFLASPLLILLMAYDFDKFRRKYNFANFSFFILSTFAFFLTGTRAHILISIFFPLLYLLISSNNRAMVKVLVLLVAAIIPAFALEEVGDLMGAFFSTSEASNSIKLSMLDGYWIIFSNPLTLLFGQGFNAHDWSPTLRDMIAMEVGASKTELTYLELVRVFGLIIPVALILTIFMLLRVAKNLAHDFAWIYPGFIIFLANAAINPYLFSVNGILPLGLIAAIAYHCSPDESRNASMV
jgi:hypothetical protein